MAAYWLLNPASFAVPIPDNLLDGYGQRGQSRFTMQSYAAFGEVNFAFTPRLTGTVGLRYTYEDKWGSYATQVFGGADLTGLPTATANELARAKLSIFRPQSYAPSDKGGSLSGRTNLSYQWTDGLFTYVSYAHGFKSGGLNMSGLPLNALNQPALSTAVIRDERNDTLELGLKSTLFGGSAKLNLAAFNTRVHDYQANIVSSQETASIRSYPANIPAVRVRGAEGDFTAALFGGLALRASVAYADGINTDYPAGPCPLELQSSATVACDLTGVRLAGLSKWTGSLGLDYATAAGPGRFTLHADWSARTGYNSDTTASRYTRIGGYGVLNASIGYRFPGDWEIQAFARNLLDKDYLTALTIQTGNSGLILGQAGDPRLAGVLLRARF
jgi:iron complex outermembrane receptor protein